MANEGHIIIQSKSGRSARELTYRAFYGPLDKGSAKPSFCYPKRKEDLTEEVEKMKAAIDSGYVSKDRLMDAKINLKTKKERLDAINKQEDRAKKLFEENKDTWIKRRKELAEEITAATPTLKDTQQKRVNPFTTLKKEKSGLEDKKREFIVLSRLAGEESNVSFLQRESA